MDIKNLPENEKPREKLMMRGAETLSDAELLAVLIGSGTRKLPVMELSERLIEFDESGILFLAECVPEELCSISGIGKAKACKLVAAIELGKRIAKKPRDGRFTASRPDKVAMYVMEELRYLKREVFLVMMLNTKGEVIAFEKVAEGDINSAAVKAREIFNKAVRKNAFSVILVHNHPSGDPAPSRADIETTERLVEAGSIIGIPVADHLIIGNGSFYSFKENKIM
ncbi:MAG: DNA repair protein RadC [Firmicutes bacterium]|nr:DNA repair protein RadC [Bacillota bacterium]